MNDHHGYSREDRKAQQLAQTFKQYGMGACPPSSSPLPLAPVVRSAPIQSTRVALPFGATAQLSNHHPRLADPPQYLSETRSGGKGEAAMPVLWESGVKTGFGGHMPGAKYVVGSSVYNLEKSTKGHFSTRGLAAQAGN